MDSTDSPMWALPPAEPMVPLAQAGQAELLEVSAPPVGMVDVINWQFEDADVIAAQFEPMREFVDWLITVYDLRGSVIPPCWPRHPKLILELYGLYAIFPAAFIPGDPGQGPLGWAERFAIARQRLRDMTQETGCNDRSHVSPVNPPVLTTTDDYWWDLTNGDIDWVSGAHDSDDVVEGAL